jgi:hypothetical protein
MSFKKVLIGLVSLGVTTLAFACTTAPTEAVGESEGALDEGQCKLVCTWKQIKGEGGYNIYVKECHAACIRFISDNPTEIVGACTCQPGGSDGIEGHTINWYIKDPDSKTPSYCIVEPQNGSECCWPVVLGPKGEIPQPPPTDSGEGKTCLEKKCGKQYAGGVSKCDKVGEGLPKVPNSTDCKQKFPGDSSKCNTCCDDRAGYWDAVWIDNLKKQIAAEKDPAKKKALQDELDKRLADREEFRKACKNACRLTPDEVDGGPDDTNDDYNFLDDGQYKSTDPATAPPASASAAPSASAPPSAPPPSPSPSTSARAANSAGF